MPHPLLRLAALPLCAASLLAACQSSPPTSSADVQMPESTASVRIQGEALYFENIVMPEGSRLRVKILDNRLADTQRAVLSDQLSTVGAGPYAFAIDVPRAKLREGGQYGLHVSLSMPDGRLRFITDTRVPVTIGDGALDVHVGQVRLRHVQP